MAGIWDRLGVSSLLDNPVAVQLIGLAAVIVVAWVALRIMRRVLVSGIRSIADRLLHHFHELVGRGDMFQRVPATDNVSFQVSVAFVVEILDEFDPIDRFAGEASWFHCL